jgi:hypothetical protein
MSIKEIYMHDHGGTAGIYPYTLPTYISFVVSARLFELHPSAEDGIFDNLSHDGYQITGL